MRQALITLGINSSFHFALCYTRDLSMLYAVICFINGASTHPRLVEFPSDFIPVLHIHHAWILYPIPTVHKQIRQRAAVSYNEK
jgi:hypothetical protein